MSKTYVLIDEEDNSTVGVFDEDHKTDAELLFQDGDGYQIKVFETNVPTVAKGAQIWVSAVATGKDGMEKILLTSTITTDLFDKCHIQDMEQFSHFTVSDTVKWLMGPSSVIVNATDADIIGARMVFAVDDYIKTLNPDKYQQLIFMLERRKCDRQIFRNYVDGEIRRSQKLAEILRSDPAFISKAMNKNLISFHGELSIRNPK